MRVSATMNTIAGRSSFSMTSVSSGEVEGADNQVDGLDADERNDDSADAVDEQIASHERGGTDRTIAHPFERQRNKRDNDQRVEDDGGENRALRRRQAHDVEHSQLRVEGHEHCRDD